MHENDSRQDSFEDPRQKEGSRRTKFHANTPIPLPRPLAWDPPSRGEARINPPNRLPWGGLLSLRKKMPVFNKKDNKKRHLCHNFDGFSSDGNLLESCELTAKVPEHGTRDKLSGKLLMVHSSQQTCNAVVCGQENVAQEANNLSLGSDLAHPKDKDWEAWMRAREKVTALATPPKGKTCPPWSGAPSRVDLGSQEVFLQSMPNRQPGNIHPGGSHSAPRRGVRSGSNTKCNTKGSIKTDAHKKNNRATQCPERACAYRMGGGGWVL